MKKINTNNHFSLFLGICFFSFSVLLFELSLTRVFSILQWNFLAFMIISIAFLGYGASGTFLAVFSALLKRARKNNLHQLLAIFSLIFSLSSLGSIFFILKIPFDLYRTMIDRYQIIYLIAYYLAIALPFFFAGVPDQLGATRKPGRVDDSIGSGRARSATGGPFPPVRGGRPPIPSQKRFSSTGLNPYSRSQAQ